MAKKIYISYKYNNGDDTCEGFCLGKENREHSYEVRDNYVRVYSNDGDYNLYIPFHALFYLEVK